MNPPKKPQTNASRPAPKASTGKPAAKKQSPKQGTGAYLMGWLGRQVGHVKRSVQADVTKKPGAKNPAAQPSPSTGPKGSKSPAAAKPSPRTAEQTTTTQEKIIYREDKIEEAPLPDRPGVILRRTIIDEVVVETETNEPNEKRD